MTSAVLKAKVSVISIVGTPGTMVFSLSEIATVSVVDRAQIVEGTTMSVKATVSVKDLDQIVARDTESGIAITSVAVLPKAASRNT